MESSKTRKRPGIVIFYQSYELIVLRVSLADLGVSPRLLTRGRCGLLSYSDTFVVLSLGFTVIGKLNITKYLLQSPPSYSGVSCEVQL